MTQDQWLKNFAYNLRAVMESQGMRQTDLAFHSHLSEATISKYLAGVQMPSAKALNNLSEALGIPVGLLTDFGGMVD